MRLVGSNTTTQEIKEPQKLSLDELFEIAAEFGTLETGGTFNKHGAEIHLNFTGGDYITIISKNAPTVAENIAVCIKKARSLHSFYQSDFSALLD